MLLLPQICRPPIFNKKFDKQRTKILQMSKNKKEQMSIRRRSRLCFQEFQTKQMFQPLRISTVITRQVCQLMQLITVSVSPMRLRERQLYSKTQLVCCRNHNSIILRSLMTRRISKTQNRIRLKYKKLSKTPTLCYNGTHQIIWKL